MNPAHSDDVLLEVLLAFSVEPTRDRSTLERYVKRFPQYAEDLIDLLSELRGEQRGGLADDETAFRGAWNEFAGTPARHDADSYLRDPFSSFRGMEFVSLAQTLRIPRSVLIALRDRLVIVSSIPEPFLGRLVRAMGSTPQIVLAYLDQPPTVARSASYKSSDKPGASAKVSFAQLLENSGIADDQKRAIYTSTD